VAGKAADAVDDGEHGRFAAIMKQLVMGHDLVEQQIVLDDCVKGFVKQPVRQPPSQFARRARAQPGHEIGVAILHADAVLEHVHARSLLAAFHLRDQALDGDGCALDGFRMDRGDLVHDFTPKSGNWAQRHCKRLVTARACDLRTGPIPSAVITGLPSKCGSRT